MPGHIAVNETEAGSLSVGDVLRLLGAGATGPILMALGPRPLRTKTLTERVPQYTPRTVYRYAAKLAEVGLIQRREEQGTPSTVIHNLSSQKGRELFRLLDAYASAALPQGPVGQIDDGSWTRVRLLGELWDLGWLEHLSREARSPTELAESTEGLTFHQANRRAHLVLSRGLLRRQANGRGRGVRYQLSEQARQGMALVAGVGRWRQRHVLQNRKTGLTVSEMATILHAALPLVTIPECPEKSIKLGVAGAADDAGGRGSEILVASVRADGTIKCHSNAMAAAEGWAVGTINTWFAAILHGNRGRLRVGGDMRLVDASLTQLYRVLWRASGPSQA